MMPPSSTVEVALLDRSGVIVAVNDAWEDFCRSNGGDLSRAGVGVSYLGICDTAGDLVSAEVAVAIRRAAAGDLPAPLRVEVRCAGPSGTRSYDVLVSSRFGDDGDPLGVTVTFSAAESSADSRADVPAHVPAHVLTEDDAAPVSSEIGLLSASLDALADGLVLVEPSGRILHVNRRIEEMSGFTRADLVHQRVEVLVPLDERDRHARLRAGFARGEELRPMGVGAGLTLRRRDGTFVPVEIALRGASVEGRHVVVAMVRDISERQAVRHREYLLAEAMDAISDGVVVLDATTGRRVYANRSVLERSGYRRAELDQVPLGAPSSAEEEARIQAAVRQVVGGDAGEVVVDSCVMHRDGTVLPVELRITHRPAPVDGVGSGLVILVARDIRERLLREERLRISEESFRAAFSQSPIGTVVVLVDDEGARQIRLANAAMGEILGLSAAELVGRDLTDFTYADDDTIDRSAARGLAGGRIHHYTRHKRYHRPDGKTVWVDVRASLIDFPDIGGRTVLSHVVDVTRAHETERRRIRQAAISEVISQVTTGVLAGQPVATTYQQVVDGVAGIFEAETVTLAIPDRFTGRLAVAAAAGPAVTPLRRDELGEDQSIDGQVGPFRVLRFGPESATAGLLTVVRARGGAPFDDEETALLVELTRQLALGIELGSAREDQQRLAVLEDRGRLARDLHDTVIQDLIGIGMQLDAELAGEIDPLRAARHDAIIDQLDETVRRLRGAVFQLKQPLVRRTLVQTLMTVTEDAARALGHRPSFSTRGPVDDLPPEAAQEIVAVLREALSNVIRHAGATSTRVALLWGARHLSLVVVDDGVGPGPGGGSGQGLLNMQFRATAFGGYATLRPRTPTGSRLLWRLPPPPWPDERSG